MTVAADTATCDRHRRRTAATTRALDHREVGNLPRLNRPEPVRHAAELGGNRRERRERVRLGQAPVQREAEVLAEDFPVRECVRGERDFEALRA